MGLVFSISNFFIKKSSLANKWMSFSYSNSALVKRTNNVKQCRRNLGGQPVNKKAENGNYGISFTFNLPVHIAHPLPTLLGFFASNLRVIYKPHLSKDHLLFVFVSQTGKRKGIF